jgi:hypothetical protein
MPHFLDEALHKSTAASDAQALPPLLLGKLHLSHLKGNKAKGKLIFIGPVMRNVSQGLHLSNKYDPH